MGTLTVRAKFQCHYVQPTTDGGEQVHMNAVYSTDGENAAFAKATPGGSFVVKIDKDTPATGYFQQGKSYYFDITEAPAK